MLYFYGNLDRRTDRNTAMQKRLQSLGFSDVYRFSANDREDYASPMELAAAAAADGFACWEDVLPERHEDLRFYGIRFWALNWTYMQMLRAAANQDAVVLISHDDWAPSKSYDTFIEQLKEIPNFDIAQVQWDIHSTKYLRLCHPASKHWKYCVASTGQDVSVFTPAGAKWMLDRCAERPFETAETLIFNCGYGTDIYIYHHKDPDAVMKSLDGYNVSDAMTDGPWYQGNYGEGGPLAN